MFLTVEQTAERLQLSPLTVQRQLKRGALRGVKRGRVWRVPESALGESSPPSVSTPTQQKAAAILAGMMSGETSQRHAALLQLAGADAPTRAIIERAGAQQQANYAGPQDDMSDWLALDTEPFVFPDEADES